MKPNNLLINSDGVLNVGDLGLEKFHGPPNGIYIHIRWLSCGCAVYFKDISRINMYT